MSRNRRARMALATIERHYRPEEVAELLGMSPRWVRDRIRAGDFGDPATDGPVLIGGSDWRVPATALEAYLARQRSAAAITRPDFGQFSSSAAGF